MSVGNKKCLNLKFAPVWNMFVNYCNKLGYEASHGI